MLYFKGIFLTFRIKAMIQGYFKLLMFKVMVYNWGLRFTFKDNASR
jgi:hypothetical protein